jgi:hypothetical protein
MRKKRARDDSWRPVPVRCHILDPLAASDMTCRSGWTALWWPNHMRVSSILTVFDILNVFRYIYCKGFKVRTSPWCEKKAQDDSWRPMPVRCHILDPLAASYMTCRTGWMALSCLKHPYGIKLLMYSDTTRTLVLKNLRWNRNYFTFVS